MGGPKGPISSLFLRGQGFISSRGPPADTLLLLLAPIPPLESVLCSSVRSVCMYVRTNVRTYECHPETKKRIRKLTYILSVPLPLVSERRFPRIDIGIVSFGDLPAVWLSYSLTSFLGRRLCPRQPVLCPSSTTTRHTGRLAPDT